MWSCCNLPPHRCAAPHSKVGCRPTRLQPHNRRGFSMKKALFVLLLVPGLGCAPSPFDGTWKFNPAKAELPKKPLEFLVQNGMYECKSCVPMINVKADG